MVGHALAYKDHRRISLLVLGAGGGVLFFVGMYWAGSELIVYLGLAAMVAASVTDLLRRLRMRRQVKLGMKPE
jgi:hypothetical protein